MKKLIAWIALAVMNSMAFSQNLTPQVHLVGKDTLFCFTLSQSKAIAKHLVNSEYCDSVLTEAESKSELLERLNTSRDSTINVLELKNTNQQCIINNQDDIIRNLNLSIKRSEKQKQWQLWQKRFFALGVIVLGITSILKK